MTNGAGSSSLLSSGDSIDKNRNLRVLTCIELLFNINQGTCN